MASSKSSRTSVTASYSYTSATTKRTKSVTKTDAPLRFRRGGSPGYWAIFMLPLAIYLADRKFKNQSYPAVILITQNAIFLSILHAWDVDLHRILKKLRLACPFIFLAITFYGWHIGEMFQYFFYAALTCSFPFVFKNMIKHYPFSFTFGEGMLVTAAFMYNFWATSQNLIFNDTTIRDKGEPVLLTLVLELAFFGVLLLARILLLISRPFKFFGLEEMICLWTKGCFISFTYTLTNILDDIFFLSYFLVDFLLGSKSRLIFLGGWIGCVIMGAWFINLKNSLEAETTTVDRKFFHLLVCVVFLPAIFKDFNLIYFCSAVVMLGFFILETIRVLRFCLFEIQFGKVIDGSVSRFRDNRDEGKLILTPIYLLAGCSMPIWLTGLYAENIDNGLTAEEIAGALSGVLSIGIGDTFASIGGYYFGKTFWPGTNKTVEGTSCSVAAQIGSIILFCLMDAMPYSTISILALCVSAVVNALVEAFTDQIDNIVLPLVTFNTIYIIKVLSENM